MNSKQFLQRLYKAQKQYLWLMVVLLVAFVHGIIYIFIIHPWQHYDEPNHFEYAWLIANHRRLPAAGESDKVMRWAVAQSMIEHGFFKGRVPAQNPKDDPISIGVYSQLNDPPLYYIYASLPLWIMDRQEGHENIYGQLIAMRFMSLLLYLLTIWIAWGLAGDLTSPTHPLRWLLPLCIALLPAFTDLMTSVNNDVGAIALFSFFLWGAVRLVRQGFSLKAVLWTAITAALCFWTKNTAWVAIPLFLVALVLSILRNRWKWILWGVTALGGIAVLIAGISWGDAAGWYRHSLQDSPTRTTNKNAPVGDFVFVLQNTPGETSRIRLVQSVPYTVIQRLPGKRVTLGAWIWASKPVQEKTPVLQISVAQVQFTEPITISTTPTFYAFTIWLPENARDMVISLSPFTGKTPAGLTVYFDGVVLAKGNHPAEEPPIFDDAKATAGIWAGKRFTNLLQAGSAELVWPRVRPIVDRVGEKVLPDRGRPSLVLYSLLDGRAGGPYYRLTLRQLFWTFWAKFGWGSTPLLGHKPYRLVGFLTLISLAGMLAAAWRQRARLPWHLVLVFGMTILAVWGLTLLRGSIYIIYRPYIPTARYTYPAILPVMLGLITGWLSWMPEKYHAYERYFLAGFFIILDVVSIVSILTFYKA